MAPFLERQFRMARGCERAMHERSLRAPGASGTILYVHGLGESGLCFERVMADPRLARWEHLAVDLESYGKSMWARQPLSLAEHADRLHDLIGQRFLEDVVVLGHSMGGVIGTLLCERLGSAARGFVNVEGNVTLPDCGYSSRAVRYTLAEWLDHGFDRVLDAIHDHEGEGPEVRRAYGASILMCDPRAYLRNSHELVEVSKTETMAARIAALAAPTIYVHGAPRGTCDGSLDLLARRRRALADRGRRPLAVPGPARGFRRRPPGFSRSAARANEFALATRRRRAERTVKPGSCRSAGRRRCPNLYY